MYGFSPLCSPRRPNPTCVFLLSAGQPSLVHHCTGVCVCVRACVCVCVRVRVCVCVCVCVPYSQALMSFLQVWHRSAWINSVAAFSCGAVSGVSMKQHGHLTQYNWTPWTPWTTRPCRQCTPVPYMGAPEAGVKSSGIWDTVVAPGLLDCWSWPLSGQPVRIQWEGLLHAWSSVGCGQLQAGW